MKKPSVIGIIPARMDSSRLPGKLLKSVNGIPLIDYVIARAKRIEGLTELIIATTDRSVDDPLAEHADAQGLQVFRGNTENVAQRLLNCASEFGAQYFVRLNGDSPYADPELIMEGMQHCYNHCTELVTNLIGRTFPYGIAVEIIQTKAFKRAYDNMHTNEEYEHVTRYLYKHINMFQVKPMISPSPELNKARLVVDTENDLDMFRKMTACFMGRAVNVGYKEAARKYLSMK